MQVEQHAARRDRHGERGRAIVCARPSPTSDDESRPGLNAAAVAEWPLGNEGPSDAAPGLRFEAGRRDPSHEHESSCRRAREQEQNRPAARRRTLDDHEHHHEPDDDPDIAEVRRILQPAVRCGASVVVAPRRDRVVDVLDRGEAADEHGEPPGRSAPASVIANASVNNSPVAAEGSGPRTGGARAGMRPYGLSHGARDVFAGRRHSRGKRNHTQRRRTSRCLSRALQIGRQGEASFAPEEARTATGGSAIFPVRAKKKHGAGWVGSRPPAINDL